MVEESALYNEFEQFVIDLFKRNDVTILNDVRQAGDYRDYALKVRSGKNATAVVELKLYRSLKVASDVLRRAFDKMEGARQRANADRGILVTNARVPVVVRQEMLSPMTIWDFDAISMFVSTHPDLGERWGRISQEGFIHRSEALPEPTPIEPIGFIDGSSPPGSPPSPPRKLSHGRGPLGANLCKRLNAIKPGRGRSAVDFENTCVEALKYLFDGDMINWTLQRKTHDQLHRYDLIARIASQNDFWNSLVSDHRGRFIIFEFKNYKDKITQAEVYSTEKYLFPQAMRSTGIIISREGANRNAIRVMHGAFRESGKLILSIDLKQMCDMLHKRDDGNDPSTVLDDLIQDMLVGLER